MVRVILALVVTAATVRSEQITLNVALGHPVLEANKKQITYVKVGLTGFTMASNVARPPVNVAIVIDKSGSMQGEKIVKAREAAIMAISRLTYRDIASVVAYSDTVEVLVPATKLASHASVCAAIRRLEAGGSTALFAGVSKGAQELRKFLNREYVNRVILISDGIANVGPSSPSALGELGSSLIKEGISVTTVGLGMGYNEDLMSRLAKKSDGNHYFAENATDLARVFTGELGDVLSVVAQEVLVKIEFAEGMRPVRVLGREADITGRTVCAVLNQLYSEQEKYVMVEVEVPATSAGQVRPVADVAVSYANMLTKTRDRLSRGLSVGFSQSKPAIEDAMDKKVMVSAVEMIATATNGMAVKLRDQGKIDEARTVLINNKKFLEVNGVELDSKLLKDYADMQEEDAENLTGKDWRLRRKIMVEEQQIRELQRKR